MPVIVTVDHERREVISVCLGSITLTDALGHMEREERERGLSYPKFVDARGSGFQIGEDEARQIAEALRTLAKVHRLGPAAVLVSSDSVFEATELVGKQAEGVCEIRAFRDEKEAREWLHSRPISIKSASSSPRNSRVPRRRGR